MGEVLVLVARVQHETETLGGQTVNDQVVDRAAAFQTKERVDRAADGDADLTREGVVEESLGVGPLDVEGSHMRDIKKTGRRTHALVLVDDARILHRHLVSRKGYEAGFQLDVTIPKRSFAQRFGHARSSSKGG